MSIKYISLITIAMDKEFGRYIATFIYSALHWFQCIYSQFQCNYAKNVSK